MNSTASLYNLLLDESEIRSYPLFNARDIDGLKCRAEALSPKEGRTGHYFYQEILLKWIDALAKTQIDKDRIIQLSADTQCTEEDFLIQTENQKNEYLKSLESKTFLTKEAIENYRKAMEEIFQKIQFALSNENYRKALEKKVQLEKEKKQESEMVLGPNEAPLLYPIEIAELEDQFEKDIANAFEEKEEEEKHFTKKRFLPPLLKELSEIKLNTQNMKIVDDPVAPKDPFLSYCVKINEAKSNIDNLGQLSWMTPHSSTVFPPLSKKKISALKSGLDKLKQNTRQSIKKFNPDTYQEFAGGKEQDELALHQKEKKKLTLMYCLYLLWTPFSCILSTILTLYIFKCLCNHHNHDGCIQVLIDCPHDNYPPERTFLHPYHSLKVTQDNKITIENKINAVPRKAIMS